MLYAVTYYQSWIKVVDKQALKSSDLVDELVKAYFNHIIQAVEQNKPNQLTSEDLDTYLHIVNLY